MRWKVIDDYPNYMISDTGLVKTIDGLYLKLYNSRKMNYYKVVYLYKDKIRHKFYIHRLVALIFIPNPNNYKEVNHKDENKLNNNVSNLEWCDRKYNNNNYGTRNIRIGMTSSKIQKGKPRLYARTRVIIDDKKFDSVKIGAKHINTHWTYLIRCIKNNKLCKGHKVEYGK